MSVEITKKPCVPLRVAFRVSYNGNQSPSRTLLPSYPYSSLLRYAPLSSVASFDRANKLLRVSTYQLEGQRANSSESGVPRFSNNSYAYCSGTPAVSRANDSDTLVVHVAGFILSSPLVHAVYIKKQEHLASFRSRKCQRDASVQHLR